MESQKSSIAFFGTFLSRRGYYKTPCEELADRFENYGWNVIRSSCSIGRLSRLVDMVATVYSKRFQTKFAIIETYSGFAFIWAEIVGFCLKIFNIPYIAVLHGGNLPEFSKKHRPRIKSFLKNAYKVVSPSLYLKNQLKELHSEIEHIPNPLEIKNYSYKIRTLPKPNLVWLRAFHEIYNPSLAVRVLKKLVEMGIDAHLTMIGPDKQDGSLEKTKNAAIQLNVLDLIEFAGPISKESVPFWLQKYDIFINTTNIDNIPVSVLEAMASGLCVVSTDAGGLPYLIDNMQDGILVPTNDEKSMANAIIEILSNSALAEKISQGARKKAEKHDIAASMPKWKALIQSIIDEQQTASNLPPPS